MPNIFCWYQNVYCYAATNASLNDKTVGLPSFTQGHGKLFLRAKNKYKIRVSMTMLLSIKNCFFLLFFTDKPLLRSSSSCLTFFPYSHGCDSLHFGLLKIFFDVFSFLVFSRVQKYLHGPCDALLAGGVAAEVRSGVQWCSVIYTTEALSTAVLLR